MSLDKKNRQKLRDIVKEGVCAENMQFENYTKTAVNLSTLEFMMEHFIWGNTVTDTVRLVFVLPETVPVVLSMTSRNSYQTWASQELVALCCYRDNDIEIARSEWLQLPRRRELGRRIARWIAAIVNTSNEVCCHICFNTDEAVTLKRSKRCAEGLPLVGGSTMRPCATCSSHLCWDCWGKVSKMCPVCKMTLQLC